MTNFAGLFPNEELAQAVLRLVFSVPNMSSAWYAEQMVRMLNGLCTHAGEIEAKAEGDRVYARTLTRPRISKFVLVMEHGEPLLSHTEIVEE